jgi:hypothetical protein
VQNQIFSLSGADVFKVGSCSHVLSKHSLAQRFAGSWIPRLLRDFHLEFSGFSAYAKDADEFVRLSCRGYAGWRRDEWAYSPLFIWGKCSGLETDFSSSGFGFWNRSRVD